MFDARPQRRRRALAIDPDAEGLRVLQRPGVLDRRRVLLAAAFQNLTEFEPGLVLVWQLTERPAQQRFGRGPVAGERGAPGIS